MRWRRWWAARGRKGFARREFERGIAIKCGGRFCRRSGDIGADFGEIGAKGGENRPILALLRTRRRGVRLEFAEVFRLFCPDFQVARDEIATFFAARRGVPVIHRGREFTISLGTLPVFVENARQTGKRSGRSPTYADAGGRKVGTESQPTLTAKREGTNNVSSEVSPPLAALDPPRGRVKNDGYCDLREAVSQSV